MISIRRFVYEQHWTIGFIEEPIQNIISNKPYVVHYVKGMPKDRWFADPFILDYNDSYIYVLVEEFCYSVRRGRIAKLEIARNDYRLVDYKILLDKTTHLSFPFIFRENGQIYVCPENSASGMWTRYRYDKEKDVLLREDVLIDAPLTDAIISNLFGERLVISTIIPNQNGNILSVYSNAGYFIKDLKFESNIARNAGDIISIGDKVYRPAQDCNGSYGKAVILQEVLKSDNGSFTFKNVGRIESNNDKFTTGCHTFNTYNGLSVIDVHGWRKPHLVNFVNAMRKLAHL